MSLLKKKLLQELKKRIPDIQGSSIVLGVSGGADSVALLRGFHALQKELQTELTIAHFDHQTRGEQSREDALWVEQLSQQLGLNCIIGTPEQQTDSASSTALHNEEALRDQRLQFLAQTAQQQSSSIICLAHHADDQAETVLHHIIRGTGIQGLKGIPACRSIKYKPLDSKTTSQQITLLHPMLGVSRSEILDYLQDLNQEFRTDASNQDPKYTRNRIRHELLPMLQELNPQATKHLTQLSEQVTQTLEHLQLDINQLSQDCLISIDKDLIRLKASVLQTAPSVLVKELFRSLWIDQQWPRKKMNSHHWESLARFTQNKQARLDLPAGVTAQKRGDMIALERKS